MLQLNKTSDPENGILEQIVDEMDQGEIDPQMKEFRDHMCKTYYELHAKTIEQQIDVYEKHLSEETIDAINAHYSTPEGIEFVEKMPAISKDLAKLSIKLSQELAKEFEKKLSEQLSTEYMGFKPEPVAEESQEDEELKEFKRRYNIP